MTVLRIEALSHHYPPHVSALRAVQLTLTAGELGLVTGTNGAGKSTLLRCGAGTLTPTQGRVAYQGRGAAYLGEADYLYADATVHDNLSLIGTLTRRETEVESIAEAWGLGDWADRLCATLSCGQRRRVALARAWLVGRDLLCLDEPLRGLDADGVHRFRGAAAQFLGNGGMMLMAAQTPEGIPLAATQTWELTSGHLQARRAA